MNLKDSIRQIVELQETDSQIYNLKKEKDFNKPAELEKIINEFEQKKQGFSDSEEKIKEVLLEKKNKELDLGTKEDALRKAQTQLYQLKTNKEYHAKLTEIGSIKADISIIEDELIKTLVEVDVAQNELNLAKEKLNLIEKDFKDQENKIKYELKDITIKIDNLVNKRTAFCNSIETKVLIKYEDLLNKRQGLAIAPVLNQHCGACYMLLNHQKINEIKMYADLTLCESCVRILYIEDDIIL